MQSLISAGRFDLGFKLCLLHYINKKPAKIFEEAYVEHLRIITNGSFIEFDNIDKDSSQEYISVFNRLNDVVANENFDGFSQKIPVSNEEIINGSHRAACLIYYDKSDTLSYVKESGPRYTYQYFWDRMDRKDLVRLAAIQLSQHLRSSRVIILWGGSIKKSVPMLYKLLESNQILYEENLEFSDLGKLNYIDFVYKSEPWVDSKNANYGDVRSKAYECFGKSAEVRIFVVLGISNHELLHLKNEIRSSLGNGKHSVHTADSHTDSLRLLQSSLNPAFLHFINNARPRRFSSFSVFLNSERRKSYLYTGSIVMASYGLRENEDIDVICDENDCLNIDESSHLHQSRFYHKSFPELRFDPFNSFEINGVKLLSLSALYEMKMRRREKKDISDLESIGKMLSNNSRHISLDRIEIFKNIFFVYKDLVYAKLSTIRIGKFLIKIYSQLKSFFVSQ